MSATNAGAGEILHGRVNIRARSAIKARQGDGGIAQGIGLAICQADSCGVHHDHILIWRCCSGVVCRTGNCRNIVEDNFLSCSEPVGLAENNFVVGRGAISGCRIAQSILINQPDFGVADTQDLIRGTAD